MFIDRMECTVPHSNIIDNILRDLVNCGKLASTTDVIEITIGGVTMPISNMWSEEYWNKFVSMIDAEHMAYVLKFRQGGNWNRYLYNAVVNAAKDNEEVKKLTADYKATTELEDILDSFLSVLLKLGVVSGDLREWSEEVNSVSKLNSRIHVMAINAMTNKNK